MIDFDLGPEPQPKGRLYENYIICMQRKQVVTRRDRLGVWLEIIVILLVWPPTKENAKLMRSMDGLFSGGNYKRWLRMDYFLIIIND